MDDVTGTIPQALDLDMTRTIDILLNEAPSIPKRIQRLVTSQSEHAFQIVLRGDDAYAASAASHGSLDDYGVCNAIGRVVDPCLGLGGGGECSVGSYDYGNVGFDG